nr:helix-turn-helix domain-containing protein [Candidatus Gracilibacteria bacterium]
MLNEVLKNYGFSDKEAKIYLSCLELGNAIASSIARKAGENRVTTYSILKELISRGIINELQKNGVKYFSAISPEELIKHEEQKLEKLKGVLPELMAISNAYNNKTKVYYYDGLNKVKELFIEIVDEGDYLNEPFLVFVGTQNMDERFKEFFDGEFKEYRLKQKTPTKAIISDRNSNYSKYHQENHNTLIIEDEVFEMGNEIVIYGAKVAILSYNKDEIYGLVIESKVLSKGLKSMFNLIRKTYKK